MPIQDQNSFLDAIRPDDLDAIYKEFGATAESIARDAKTLRLWTKSQPHLPALTENDEVWLSRYLLHCKNSLERAKKRLDTYFSARRECFDMYNYPPSSRDNDMFANTAFLASTPVPKLLPGGYVLYLERFNHSPSMVWELHLTRAVMSVDLVLGTVPIRGYDVVFDARHLSFNLITSAAGHLTTIRRYAHCCQDAIPMRIRTIHVINCPAPALVKAGLALITPLLRDNLQNRIIIHENMDSFYKHVPREYLPVDYGGHLPLKFEDYQDLWNQYLRSRKSWFDGRSHLVADESKRLNKSVPTYGTEGSFRKLEVD